MERLVEREMNSIFLSIRNQLAKVEVTVDNMEWVVNESLSQPDTLFTITHRLVEYNPSIQGCGILFTPNYYPQKGRFLVTNSGTLLAGEDNQTFQAVLELLKADSDNEGYVKRTASDGEKQHVFFHPVGGKTDWVLIDVLNDKDVFGQLRQIRLLLAILVVTGMVLVGFIVYRSSRNLERLRQVDAEKAISIILA